MKSTAQTKTKKLSLNVMILLVNIGMFVVLAYLVFHERSAYFSLRKNAARVLMSALSHNLEYSIKSETKLKEQLKNDLLTLASFFEQETVSPKWVDINKLTRLAKRFNVYKVVVLNKKGETVFVSKGRFGRRNIIRKELLQVCSGKRDFYVIGLKQSYRKNGYRFGVVKQIKTGALVLMVDATYLHNIFNSISFFHVLESISKYKDIEFVRFEKEDNVVFEHYNSPFYKKDIVFLPPKAEGNEGLSMRVIKSGNFTILEVARIISFDGVNHGTLRIGLSLSYIKLLDRDFLLLTIVLFFLVVLLDSFYAYAIKQTAKLYQESSKFHSVINQIEDGILIKQKDESFFCNNAVFKLVGGEKDKVLSMKDGAKTFDINGKKILAVKNSYPFGEVFIIRDVTIEEVSKESKEREKKIFSMGKLASSFAHEVRNPLNTISMIVQQFAFSEKLSSEEKEMIEIIKKEIERLNKIVKEFMEVSKTPQLKLEKVKMSSFLSEIEAFYGSALAKDSKKLVIEVKDDFISEIDCSRFKGVIINLIQNSFEAGADTVEIVVKQIENFGILSVRDNGKAMSEEERERAFDLYFTTKTEGSGLGLPYVQRIVTLHGGFVKLESKKGEGTVVDLYLPLKGES